MLRPGRILVTCSCSFAVSEEDFLSMLTEQPRIPTAQFGLSRNEPVKRPSILLACLKLTI